MDKSFAGQLEAASQIKQGAKKEKRSKWWSNLGCLVNSTVISHHSIAVFASRFQIKWIWKGSNNVKQFQTFQTGLSKKLQAPKRTVRCEAGWHANKERLTHYYHEDRKHKTSVGCTWVYLRVINANSTVGWNQTPRWFHQTSFSFTFQPAALASSS